MQRAGSGKQKHVVAVDPRTHGARARCSSSRNSRKHLASLGFDKRDGEERQSVMQRVAAAMELQLKEKKHCNTRVKPRSQSPA
eukprot:2929868-Amphidinium_carterae.1